MMDFLFPEQMQDIQKFQQVRLLQRDTSQARANLIE
jgi:hypothetical protein